MLPALPPTGKSFLFVRACVRACEAGRMENVAGVGAACNFPHFRRSLFPFGRSTSSLLPFRKFENYSKVFSNALSKTLSNIVSSILSNAFSNTLRIFF